MLFQDQFTTLGTNNDALKGGERTSAQMMSIYPDARATVLQFLCFSKVRSNIDLLAYVKENNATLNFPEKLMLLLSYVDKERDRGNHITCISWVPNGHVFLIEDPKDLVEKLLPLFFREGKFSSFTRKLYRWGFRQICIPKGNDNKKARVFAFGHEHFNRDNKGLIVHMRSVTAAGTRRAIAAMTSRKRRRKNSKSDSKVATMTPRTPVYATFPAAHVENTNLEKIKSTSKLSLVNLAQNHQDKLLGGRSNGLNTPTTVKPLSSNQKPFLEQHSAPIALDALLKAKSYSRMPNSVQNTFLGLDDPTAVQRHVNYIKLISQASMASTPAAGSLMQQPMAIDVGARLDALRRAAKSGANSSEQEIHFTASRPTLPGNQLGRTSTLRDTMSQPHVLPNASFGLPKGYLERIISGGLIKPSNFSNSVSVPNFVVPKTSGARIVEAARNAVEDDIIGASTSSSLPAALEQRFSNTEKQHWP